MWSAPAKPMAETSIPQIEYEQRWRRAQGESRALGLEGLVVWSRGGQTLDSYADVFYLTGHYPRFGMAPDLPPHWVGRSHAALLLPVDDEPSLVVDTPDWRRDRVSVSDVRVGSDVPRAVAAAVADRGLSSARLGLVGGSALLLSPYRHLLARCPNVEFVAHDDLVQDLRVLKSANELELLRESFAVGTAVMDAIMAVALRPGATEAEAVAAGYAVGVARGMAPYVAWTSSGEFSHYLAYGQIPAWTTRTLRAGDLFHTDQNGAVGGYLHDFGRSCVVGGRPSREQREILEAAIAAVAAGAEALRPGVAGTDVFDAVERVMSEHGMGTDQQPVGPGRTHDFAEVFPPHGHGMGVGWEWPWFMPAEQRRVQAGMCLAVETMVGRPGVGCAYHEEVFIVHEDGLERLSTSPERYW
jgi:Xaa-Pro aminopeptidase